MKKYAIVGTVGVFLLVGLTSGWGPALLLVGVGWGVPLVAVIAGHLQAQLHQGDMERHQERLAPPRSPKEHAARHARPMTPDEYRWRVENGREPPRPWRDWRD